MGREFRQILSGRGDAALFVQRFQVGQQRPCLGQRAGRRQIEPDECIGVGQAPARQFQRQRRQVGFENFRNAPGVQPGLRGFAP